MRTLQFFLFIAILQHSFCNYIAPYAAFSGYQVDDLFRDYDFVTWTLYGLPSSSLPYTMCGNAFIMGGYNLFAQNMYYERIYDGLPNHNFIRYRIRLFMFDDWDPQDTFVLQFDGFNISKPNLGSEKSSWPTNRCGDSGNDAWLYDIYGGLTHTASSLTVRVFSLVSKAPDKASLGFKRPTILFTNKTALDFEDWCAKATDYSSTAYQCNTCDYGKYYSTATSSCLNCDPACEVCFGPTEYGCWKCKNGYSFFEGRCQQCHSSCLICFGPNANQCINCMASADWIQADNTCTSSCPIGQQVSSADGSNKYCKTPCSNYMLLDGLETCVPSCESPMLATQTLLGKLCINPCGDDNTNYIYYDGTCSSDCNSPLIALDKTYYKLCNHLCSNPEYYYYPETGICKSTCQSPLYKSQTIGTVKFCNQTYSTKEAEEAKDTASTLNTAGNVGAGTMKAISAFNSGSPSMAFIAGLSQMLQYIKYMRIQYPSKLYMVFQAQDSGSMSLDFNIPMPDSLKQKFANQTLPSVFSEYEVVSPFLVNYWEMLSSLGLVLIAFVVFSLLVLASRKRRNINIICTRLLSVAKWDLLLMLFCGGFGDIGFYSCLDLSTNNLDSSTAIASFIICVFINICGGFVLWKTFIIALNYKKFHQEKEPNDFESYGFLHQEFNKKSFIQAGYMFFYLLRIYTFNIVIATLYNHPILQCILMIILTASMIIYMITQKPIKDPVNLVYMCINELIVLIVYVCVIIFAILDSSELENQETRLKIESIILTCNLVFGFLALAAMALQTLLQLFRFYKVIKGFKSKGFTSFVDILMIVLLGDSPDGLSDAKKTHSKNIFDKNNSSQTQIIKEKNMKITSYEEKSIQDLESSLTYLNSNLEITPPLKRRIHKNVRNSLPRVVKPSRAGPNMMTQYVIPNEMRISPQLNAQQTWRFDSPENKRSPIGVRARRRETIEYLRKINSLHFNHS